MDHDTALTTGVVARVDAILADYALVLAGDFGGYRNHARRIAIFCSALTGPAPDAEEKIAVAAAFHDIGIWTDGTFDYLDPSVNRAVTYLESTGRGSWTPEIRSMVLGHHAIRPATGMEEAFRRADWIDVSLGLRRFGLPRALVRQSFRRFPSAGFHARLVTLAVRRLRSHPLDPLPMFRW